MKAKQIKALINDILPHASVYCLDHGGGKGSIQVFLSEESLEYTCKLKNHEYIFNKIALINTIRNLK